MNFFSKKEISQKSVNINWIQLINLGQLEEINRKSNNELSVIFKHSTRCHISKTVLKNFENNFKENDKIKFYYLDLLEYRTISNAISEQLKVEHQSPQIIVIKNGKCIFHESHENIDASELEKLIL